MDATGSSSSSDDIVDPDEGPVYRAQREAEDVPGFVSRALAHLEETSPDEDFTLDRVDFETALGVWLAPIGAYEPTDDTPSTPDDVAAGASPTGPYGNVMRDYALDVRQAMGDAWGPPAVHTPRLVGSAEEPEGILDYLLVNQGIAEAELWDRGQFFAALLTDWSGEPGASNLRQILILLPREFVMSGLRVFLSDDDTAHPLLMHGEHPIEIRRRAWIMSTAFGAGEVRLRDAAIEATRCGLVARNVTTTVWTFADDGRVLLLMHDPACEFERTAEQQLADDNPPIADGLADAQMILVNRLLDGIPDDLRSCIAARAETARGGVAQHELEFRLLDGQPIPVISGAFWFDGSTWHATRGLMEIAGRNGLGIDGFGVGTAVRWPYRLGGDLTADLLEGAGDSERRLQLEQILAACPYPAQPRPEGDALLGYAIPSSADHGQIIDQIERATEAWWDRGPADSTLGDDTFLIGGRKLGRAGDPGVLSAIIGRAERWTADALRDWSERLIAAMGARWGAARRLSAIGSGSRVEDRTPVGRVMRGTGLVEGPLWWVNGHAVLLLDGVPAPAYGTDPEVIVVIARADTVRALLGRTSLWEVRLRARVIDHLAAIVASTEPDGAAPLPDQAIPWDGPALTSSGIVPRATRGSLRAGQFLWAWHFTHDGRGLLTSYEIGGAAGSFAQARELFAGVPDDLLSLVVDQAPGGPYPTVTGDPDLLGPDQLGRAGTLPDASAVFFHDGYDWRASMGLLRRIRAVGAETDPLSALHSTDLGVPQLQWALHAGRVISAESLADPVYSRHAFSRQVSLEEARQAFAQLGTPLAASLLGTLNDLLDVVVDAPGHRQLLDAALSNPDPRRRRDLALWLLDQGVDASAQLSLMTPINVLLSNPTLDAEDAGVLRRLIESGAPAGPGLVGGRPDGHPVVQLVNLDRDESEILALVEAVLDSGRCDVTAPALPDGRSVLDYVREGQFPGGRTRPRVLERVEAEALV